MNPSLDTEFLFQIRIDFRERAIYASPSGSRGYVPVVDGFIEGPRLTGRVLPHSGADWSLGRADGVRELNAHYTLQATDGSLIYIRNRGYIYRLDDAGRPIAGPPPQGAKVYFRLAPVFDAPIGPHDWLTRTIIVGSGERFSDPDHSLFRYFAVK